MRRTYVMILAAVLAALAVAGVLFISNANQPKTVTVPVASSDIPAGTVLHAPMFRGAQMSNIDPTTLTRWVTADEWATAEGKVVIGDVRAGFPLAKSQIDPNAPSGMESRLSLAVTGDKDYYVVIPATPDQVGNFIQPGDKVDVVLSLGQLQARDLTASFPATIALGITATAPAVSAPMGIPGLPVSGTGAIGSSALTSQLLALLAGQRITDTAAMPVSKLVMQDLTVMRVERAQPQQSSQQAQQVAQVSADTPASQRPLPVALDVKRIYVAVNKDQLEVMSFALNNGNRTYAVRGTNNKLDPYLSDGVTWDDFAAWFYTERGYKADGAQPFPRAIGLPTQK